MCKTKQTLENPGSLGEGRLARDLGPKEQHSNELLGFSFCLVYLRLGAREANNSETPMSTDKQSLGKASCLSQVNRKGVSWQDRKLLSNNHSAAAKHRRKTRGPSHTHTSKG